jgi:hypothetical protein
VVHLRSREIDQTEEELSKLNHIIGIIKQRDNAQQVDKQLILQHIKTLIASNPHHKPEEPSPPPAPPAPLTIPPALPKE